MKRIITLLSLSSTFIMADIIGGELNLGYYNHAPSGSVQYQGDNLNIQDNLKWSNQSDMFAKVYLEHPLPIIPNIKLGYTDFTHSGSGTVTTPFQFGNQTFNSDIQTNFNLKMYDLALYYEILDNWVNLDVGVNVKYISGSIAIQSTTQNESTNFNVPIPMLYGKARFDVPTTDLSFQVEGNYVTYEGHTLYDAEIGVRYTFLLGLGLEAGYKTMKLKLDGIDDLSMDTTFSGAYGKLVWDF